MSTVSPYLFNNTDRIGSDKNDQTQNNVHNTRYANHTFASFFSENTSSQHEDFAIQQPTMTFSGISHGNGLNGSVIDNEQTTVAKLGDICVSFALLKTQNLFEIVELLV